MTKISIITVNYNNKIGLEDTIISTINQTWKDYELIIVDGGSTDGSYNVIKKYQNNLTWWCSEEDGGIYPAMNKGVKHATGEYCIFMNSGDVFFNNKVLEIISKEGRTEDIIIGKEIGKETKKELHNIGNRHIVEFLSGYTLPHQATFIKRQLLLKYPYDEKLKIVSDWAFWIKTILINKCTYSFINVIVNIQDEKGVSSNKKACMIERMPVIEQIFPVLDENDKIKIIAGNAYILIGEILQATEDHDKEWFNKCHSWLSSFPHTLLRKVIGLPRYMLYVSFANGTILKIWLKFHQK